MHNHNNQFFLPCFSNICPTLHTLKQKYLSEYAMTSESTRAMATHADAEMHQPQTAYRPNAISVDDAISMVAVVDSI